MTREKFTYRAERDVGPVLSYEFSQLRSDRADPLHMLALPNTIRKVGSMIEEFARFEKMQRRQV